jgi:outer membrane protein assembly factor BamB
VVFVFSLALAGGIGYFASYDGKFYVLDAATDELKWKFETPGELRYAGRNLHGLLRTAETMPAPWDYFLSSPAVWNGTVYFGCLDSNVYAVDAKTGKQKWFYSTKGSWVNNSAAVYDGKVFFGTSIPGLLHAVDAKTGAEMFIQNDTSKQKLPAIQDPEGTLNFGVIMSQNRYDRMVNCRERVAECRLDSFIAAGDEGCRLRGKYRRQSVRSLLGCAIR